jgi:two-component system alkaline phosphatase synthesis response regulator PhoP
VNPNLSDATPRRPRDPSSDPAPVENAQRPAPTATDRPVPLVAAPSADLSPAADGLRHVLVVDDEPHIGRIIQMKLQQGPFRVTLAFDGRQALEVLEREAHVDLVLLDLMMPHVSGLDVLQFMRADDRYRELPCIILTAAGQEQQYRQAMALGATDFMTKPFSPKKLYARAAELAGVVDDAAREDA